MVSQVLRYYAKIALTQKKFSLPPILLAPIARIGTDYIQPLFTAAIVDKLASNDIRLRSLSWLILGYFGVPFISELLWRYIIWSRDVNDSRGMEKIANQTFEDLMNRSYDFHINNFAGSLVAKTGRFVTAFEPLYDTLVMDIAGNLIGLIFATVVLLRISSFAGIAVLIIFVLYAFVIIKLTRKRFNLNKIKAEKESLLTGLLADSLTNAITVKTFAKEKFELSNFKKANRDSELSRSKSWFFQNIPMDFITTNTVNVLNTLALVAGCVAVINGHTQVGTLIVVLMYVRNLTRSFWDTSRIMRSVESNLSNAIEMMNILSQEKDILDISAAEKLKVHEGAIVFKDAAFSYGKVSESKDLFQNFNLTIPGGQSIGLVGPSGGGKTTVTKLLLRFMDLREGSILIDGQDISSVTQISLRNAITYVPQEPLLFHRSIKENIAYGKPSATMKEIIAAATKAHAHDFIKKLPQGYHTLVGERGIKLSGGQRQRVALARAILKDAPIIVLDEATSALDSESEKLIQEALFTLMEGRTTIVIAHRLSTIKHLDRILVLEDGKIIEDGNHADLIKKKNGTYAKLWSHQSGGFIE